jgi:8-oxo-dGTP diphosphatase
MLCGRTLKCGDTLPGCPSSLTVIFKCVPVAGGAEVANKSREKNDRAISNAGQEHCYEHPRPAVTVDIILFYHDGQGMEVLLVKRARDPFKGRWAFPGGFVDENEPLEAAAARELEEETGLRNIRLEQVGAFGDPGRDPRGHTVSIAFTALLENRDKAKAADDAEDARWHSVTRPPRLAFDHKKILALALERVSAARRPALPSTASRKK